MRRNGLRKSRGKKKLEVAIVSGVLCTFFIVFALMININSNKARKQKLATAEQELKRSESELAKALDLARHREASAQAQLDKADRIIDEYESSLTAAILAQNKSQLLIEHYDSLNKELITSLESSNRLEKQHQEELVKVKKFRKRTLDYRNRVLSFYHQTRKKQREAESEIAKAKNAYNVSLDRLHKANTLTKQASGVIYENNALADRVEGLERKLSKSQSNNVALERLVDQANDHINRYHQIQQAYRQCPQEHVNPEPKKRPVRYLPEPKKKPTCEILRFN